MQYEHYIKLSKLLKQNAKNELDSDKKKKIIKLAEFAYQIAISRLNEENLKVQLTEAVNETHELLLTYEKMFYNEYEYNAYEVQDPIDKLIEQIEINKIW